MITSTVIAPAVLDFGAAHTIADDDTMRADSTDIPANLHSVDPERKLTPVIEINAPPLIGPNVGTIL
jgi:hypothetical protein